VPRPKTHDDELRVRLLERASELLAADGMAGLSLRRLAGAAGTSTSAVYSLFGGKPELLAELYAEGFRRLAARLAEVETTGDPRADLLALALAYRRNALTAPTLYRSTFGGGAGRPAGWRRAPSDGEPVPDGKPVPGDDTFATLVAAVRRCTEAGLLAGEPVDLAAALWAHVHGLVLLELDGLLPIGEWAPEEFFVWALRAREAATPAGPRGR
jgi:AcrR family transcriptional regulator